MKYRLRKHCECCKSCRCQHNCILLLGLFQSSYFILKTTSLYVIYTEWETKISHKNQTQKPLNITLFINFFYLFIYFICCYIRNTLTDRRLRLYTYTLTYFYTFDPHVLQGGSELKQTNLAVPARSKDKGNATRGEAKVRGSLGDTINLMQI